jgi:hypothetical protein
MVLVRPVAVVFVAKKWPGFPIIKLSRFDFPTPGPPMGNSVKALAYISKFNIFICSV